MKDESSVDVGRSQRSAGDWPKPGEEGFVHPDGTPQSVRQLEDNRRAAADRKMAGSTVHGAPGPGGVQPGLPAIEHSEAHKARVEHTDWVREQLAALVDEQAAADESSEPSKGRHESTASAGPREPASAKEAKSS